MATQNLTDPQVGVDHPSPTRRLVLETRQAGDATIELTEDRTQIFPFRVETFRTVNGERTQTDMLTGLMAADTQAMLDQAVSYVAEVDELPGLRVCLTSGGPSEAGTVISGGRFLSDGTESSGGLMSLEVQFDDGFRDWFELGTGVYWLDPNTAMTLNDRAAHAKASYVRRPAMTS